MRPMPRCDGRLIQPVDTKYMLDLMSNPSLVRNLALVGSVQHGKTTLMDVLIESTHRVPAFNKRFMDTRSDEQEKEISLRSTPITLALDDTSSRQFICNIMDTPGHMNFSNEMEADLRLADGVVLIVDAAEGVLLNAKTTIRNAIQDGLSIVVVLNKVDKLITDLKLLPKQAYNRLRHTIKVINNHIAMASSAAANIPVISPALGNVCFASASGGWIFTLQSFAELHVKRHEIPIDANDFAANLWGDICFDHVTGGFKNKQPIGGVEISFVDFILHPLYKFYNEDGDQEERINATLADLGVTQIHQYYRPRIMNVDNRLRSLRRIACCSVFGNLTSFTDMVVQHIPSAKDSAPQKVKKIYTGSTNSTIFRAMQECDASGPLMVDVTKLYPKPDCSIFDGFGRIYSGEIRIGQTLQVLGEGYSPVENSDMIEKVVTNLWIYQSVYRIPVTKAPAGSWVLIEGIDSCISKTATLCSLKFEDAYIFRPLQFNSPPLMKTSIQLLSPCDSTKIINGLKNVSKSYPLAIVDVEESGTCTVSGSGELYIDCLMKDMKELYPQIETKVTDYAVRLCETVSSSTFHECCGESPNRKNRIFMIATPLGMRPGENIEDAFGFDKQGPNTLVDATSMVGVDKEMINKVKVYIVQGFQWATNEGPLRGEMLRNVEFRVTNAVIAPEESDRSPFEIIIAARRAAHASFIGAGPILMEPIYNVEIQTRMDYLETVKTLLSRRRGRILFNRINKSFSNSGVFFASHEKAKFKALLPVADSFGFEKELRCCTQEKASCDMVLDKWENLPFQCPSDHNLDAFERE